METLFPIPYSLCLIRFHLEVPSDRLCFYIGERAWYDDIELFYLVFVNPGANSFFHCYTYPEKIEQITATSVLQPWNLPNYHLIYTGPFQVIEQFQTLTENIQQRIFSYLTDADSSRREIAKKILTRYQIL